MGVVEGDRENAATDPEKPRRFLHRAQEGALLLRQRGEEEVAEGHAVQLLALVGLEPMREEAHQSGVALCEDRQGATDVARRRHVQGDTNLARRSPGVRYRYEAGDVLGVA